MRRKIPHNDVTYDYENVIKEFITQLKERLGDCFVMAYLTGSYARGDATEHSDLDVFCIFKTINQEVLQTVGYCAQHTSVPYEVLEINSQCMSVQEYRSHVFEHWTEYAVTDLNGVLLYGEEIVAIEELREQIEISYRKALVDILMGIRHYICVDEPKEKLTYKKLKTYILKPLMFALRQERFCKTGEYPLSNQDLLNAYDNEYKILVEYFLNKDKLEQDIRLDHRAALMEMHRLVEQLLGI